MALLLGIDVGTSSVKALLFDPETAQTVAVAAQEYPIHKPTPDGAEQDPDDWWRAAIVVVKRATASAGRDDVAAISFSGQMHGCVLLDHDRRPMRPAIIWADQRSAAQVRQLIERVGAEHFTSIAGTLPAAGFLIATLAWLRQHEPKLLDKADRFVLPKDYVRLCMSGEVYTEVSDAASSAMLDIAQKQWSSELMQAAGVAEAICPPVLESLQPAGYLTASAAAALGLKAGIPLIAGCADQPAQSIGSGLIAPGAASVTIGSGGQVLAPLLTQHGRVPTDERLHVFNHAVPDTYYVLGAILSAGLALRWLRNLAGLQNAPNAYEILSAEAAVLPAGANGLIFLPYLSGERTPHMDPFARGCFVGLSYHHERGHLARAVMEGVSFALRQTLEISLSLAGAVQGVIAAGGGAESPVWRQMLADIFGLPLKKSLLAEQACIGAALIAGVGSVYYRDLHDACARVVRYSAPTEADESQHNRYNALYEQFLKLYPQLRGNMFELVHLGD
ncbi:MAG: xylulokinase [Chloroflexi bacterium]|nr:xylulokinase [Chloroflexota bacterium]